MSTSYDVLSASPSQDAYLRFEPVQAPASAPRAPHDLSGLTQDAKADRFIAWSRELSGEELHTRAQGLTDFEDRAHLVNAVQQFSPPLERAVFSARMNEHVRPVWNAGPRPAAAPDSAAVATAQRREFARDPAKAAAPLIAQPLLAFGVEGRRLDTPAALTNTVALGLGLDPRPRATTTLHATTQGGITRQDPRAGWNLPVQDQGGAGLDPSQQAACAKVTGKLTELGGPTPQVHVMRVVYPVAGRNALASEALFRVEGRDGQPWLVDPQGAHYASVKEYLSAPTRPQGVPIVLPQLDERLRPALGADAQPQARTHEATPGVLQSPVVRKVATGVTAGATAASLIFPPSAAITWPLLGGSAVLSAGQADRMAWQWSHQRADLDPLQNPRVLMDYGSLALGGAGLARGGLALGGASLVQSTDEALTVAGGVLGAAETGQAVLTSEGGWFDIGQAALDVAAGRRGGAGSPASAARHLEQQPAARPAQARESGSRRDDAAGSPTPVGEPPKVNEPPAVVQQPIVRVAGTPRKEPMWGIAPEMRPIVKATHDSDMRRKAERDAAAKAVRMQTPQGRAAEAVYENFLAGLDPHSRIAIEELNEHAEGLHNPKITGPDTLLYRVTDRRFLDFDTMTAAPNPNSRAVVSDYGDMRSARYSPIDEPANRDAVDFGPGLNLSVKLSPNYLDGDNQAVIAVRVGDLLDRGGVFYRDVSAGVSIQPVYVTFEGAVPFQVVEPPPLPPRRR
jgi:hypothetical protein